MTSEWTDLIGKMVLDIWLAVCFKVSMARMAHLNMIMNFLSLARTDQEKSHLTEVKQF